MHMASERALDGAILDINLARRPCFPVCTILSAWRIPFVFLTGTRRRDFHRVSGCDAGHQTIRAD